jgi:hypothetical protein
VRRIPSNACIRGNTVQVRYRRDKSWQKESMGDTGMFEADLAGMIKETSRTYGPKW